MSAYSKKEVIGVLREAGLRVTDHRVAVLLLISKVRQPVMVHELVSVLQKKDQIDQATVYRNLMSLHQAGIIRRLDFNHGHAHYELDTGVPSYMVVCNNCETIESIDGVPDIEGVIKKMLKKSKKFKKISTHSIEIYGVCKNCK